MRPIPLLTLLLGAALYSACPDTTAPVFDVDGNDAGAETTGDVKLDGNPDSSPDTAPDGSPDTAPDATPDASPDATPDAVPDAAPDASPDTTPDAVPDTPLVDVLPDAPDPDAGDTSPDVVIVVGTQNPCAPSEAPGSNNEEVTACVCAADSYCCETAWDTACVGIASTQCNAPCDCSVADPADLPCSSDADCAFCGGDACTGTFTCDMAAGNCVAPTPVVCDNTADTECLINTCDPETGACAPVSTPSLCDDGDACSADTCNDAGACVSEPIDGACQQHPCESSVLPGSNDTTVTTCVCAEDDYCCNFAWDSTCAAIAASSCGAPCDCAAADAADLPCATDDDCAFCGGDMCSGSFSCDGATGSCVPVPDVVCDASSDTECLINTCDPATGACAPQAQDSLCADDDPCTLDACSADTNLCTNLPNPACDNHPCEVSPVGNSNDPDVTSCVCALDSFCCDTQWDGACVNIAQVECNVNCDCSTATVEELACTEDSDCSFCGGDLCEAWACVANVCQAQVLVTCDGSDGSDCNVDTCNPTTGECEFVPDVTSCDDSDSCTIDACDEQGACINDPIPGCLGEPPFPCLGGSEPSAAGCDAVASNEGCCDPWGRVTFCQDGDTYCFDCAGLNPVCGWDPDNNFYDCGAEDYTEDPSGAAPLQCSGYTYAD